MRQLTSWTMVVGMLVLATATSISPAPLYGQTSAAQDDAKKSAPVIAPKQQRQLDAAHEHLAKGRYAEAMESFSALLNDSATGIPAALGLGRVHRAEGRLDEAQALLEKTIAEQSDTALTIDVQAALADLLAYRGEYQTARKLAEKIIEQDANHVLARFVVAVCMTETGDIDRAGMAWRWFVRFYNREQPEDAARLIVVGRGAAQYARWSSSSSIFRFLVNTLCTDALKDDENAWEAYYLSGKLLLEKYNRSQGLPDLKSALSVNPRAADVFDDLGYAQLERREFSDALKSAETALKINPRHIDALLLKTDVLLATEKTAEAANVLRDAEAVNSRLPQTIARRALVTMLETGYPDAKRFQTLMQHLDDASWLSENADGQFEKQLAALIQLNPRPGQYFSDLGVMLGERRQFQLAEACFNKAIEVMPELSTPRIELGLLYMQTARTKLARTVLDKAFKADRFHVRVSNMRKVLSVLESYDTISTDHFVVHFDPKQDRILARQMAEYLESIYDNLVAHYGFEPPQRTHFEIYHDAKGEKAHGWFSARMTGRRWIQTIGASTGTMVAMASPTAGKPYNWARVAKHEFVHIITLQQTSFRIPHWFTEALAVTSEGLVPPKVWHRLLAERVPQGKIWKLDELNEVFIHPDSPLDWQFAYCQSRLYAQFMIEQFGADSISQMLAEYSKGQPTNSAIQTVFGKSADEFHQEYVRFVTKLIRDRGYARIVSVPSSVKDAKSAWESDRDDATLKARYAMALFLKGDKKLALQLGQEIIENEPAHPLGSLVVAMAEMGKKDPSAVIGALIPSMEENEDDVIPDALALYAKALVEEGEQDAARNAYQRGHRLFPDDARWLRGLLPLLDDEDQKTAILEKLIRIDFDDAVPRKTLAQLYYNRADFESAATAARKVLYSAPQDPVAHRILAISLAKQKNPAAASALKSALELNPDDAELQAMEKRVRSVNLKD